jgi:antagonist of KipI
LQSAFGGLEGRALKAGDKIKSYETASPQMLAIIKSLKLINSDYATGNWFVGKNYNGDALIRVMPGPEWNWLSKIQQEKFLSQPFIISNDSNRMGYRLGGKPISRQIKDELISSGVTKGTIQLTNDGSLIVLMADSQTVGGYPRIAQVAAVDIPQLSQQKPGAEIQFDLISHEEGERLFLEYHLDLKKLETGIRLKVL